MENNEPTKKQNYCETSFFKDIIILTIDTFCNRVTSLPEVGGWEPKHTENHFA